jgi:uncharacterized membrane protein YsdA (DUF1294 family)
MFLPIYSGCLIVLSVIAFFAYCIDKGKAKKGAWRTPEKVLLGLSFFGGAIGGYAAMFVFRHKTKHWYFHVVNLLGLAWQIALFIAAVAMGNA